MKLNFFNKKLKGFTLAELMIVLAVLAVIAAVLMPTVFNSMPDENRLKFKKGYYTLKRTIDALVNSDAYQNTGGKFVELLDSTDDKPTFAGVLEDGDDGSKYFCVQFSEMLNSTETQCEQYLDTLKSGVIATNFEATTFSGGDIDSKCADVFLQGSNETVNIKTQDGIYWAMPLDNFSGVKNSNQMKNITNYNTIPAYYAVICMDVDGKGGEKSYGFGIRRDGKVVAGQRAKELLKEGTTNTLPDAD